MEESIALTWKTMASRLRNLRIGAFALLAFLAAGILIAIFLGPGRALAVLPALAGAGVLFMHRERAILFAWEDRVLALWGASDLCMGIFRQTFLDHPHALKRSLKSLAEELPENADFLAPAEGEIKSHRALFWTRALLQDIRFAGSASLLCAAASVPCALAFAHALGGGWLWLLGAVPMAALPPVRKILARVSLHRWRRRRRNLRAGSLDEYPGFAARLDGLDWSGIPPRLRVAIRKEMLAE